MESFKLLFLKKSFKVLILSLMMVFVVSCEDETEDDVTSWDCASGDCIELFSTFGLYSSRANCESECGSGGGGNSDNDGNTLGEVAFWTVEDFGCGNIEVNLEGVGTEFITGFYENGFPGCGMNLNANYTVPKGTYFYTASCNGFQWPRREINIGDCTGVQLSL